MLVNYEEWVDYAKEYNSKDDNLIKISIDDVNYIKDKLNITSFSCGPIGLYNGEGFECKSTKIENNDEFVEHFKEIKNTIILYQVLNIQALDTNNDVKNMKTVRYAIV